MRKLDIGLVLFRIFESNRKPISPATARYLLNFRVDETDRRRANQLGRKEDLGTITACERLDLMAFLAIYQEIEWLHAKALNALKRSRKPRKTR